jgi:hypothetical protein
MVAKGGSEGSEPKQYINAKYKIHYTKYKIVKPLKIRAMGMSLLRMK